MLTEQPQLSQKISEIESTIARIKEISNHLRYQNNERINRTALFKVEIKHTNEFMVDLGSEYFAQMRAQEAIKLMDFRLNYYKQRLKRICPEVKTSEALQKEGQTLGKQSTIKLEGSHTGFLECIGEQNGESIFNIVEIEGQEQAQSSPTRHNSQETANVAQTSDHKNEEKGNIHQQKATNNQKITSLQPSTFENIISEHEPQAENNKSQSQSQSQSQNLEQHESEEDQSQEQYDDIIMNHRAKLGLIPQTTLSTVDAPKSQSPEQQQVKQKPKKIVQEQEIPQKVSRFKLQRMKQKLQQQL